MESKEILEKIASEKKRLISEVRVSSAWSADDNDMAGRKGGQQVSVSPRSVCISNDEVQFRIFVGHSSSTIENRNWGMQVFEMYLDEYFK